MPRKRKIPKRGWHGEPERHAECGKLGGQKAAQDKQRMAEIGRKGALARWTKRKTEEETP